MTLTWKTTRKVSLSRILSIDIETYSDIDIKEAGSYRYIDSPAFEVLLFAYAYDDEEVEVVDLASGEKIPPQVLKDLENPNVTKCAFNDSFERIALTKMLGRKTPLPPNQWQCTMIKAYTLGLPGSLQGVCDALGFTDGKMSEGKDLIRYFCVPCKPTKTNGGRTRNYPYHDLEKWKTFKEYNKRDVEVERRVRKKLEMFPMLDEEWKIRYLDQEINDRGVRLDTELAEMAVKMSKENTEELTREAVSLTGLDNPNSPAQLKAWLGGRLGKPVMELTKKAISKMLEKDLPADVKRVLEIRQRMGKTSVKKYEKMLGCRCSDGRMHGLLQFYGANRTGRWAGRLVQVQNLPQNHLKDIEVANRLRKEGNVSEIEKVYGSLSDTLSQLVRTAFIPNPGMVFMVADFSAIEARVLAWLSGEQWRLDVFNTHGKIYEASAAQMFNVPVESIKKGDPLRQKGKVAELALGYGGSVGALVSMGALDMGLTEEELKPLVSTWRDANPHITALWWDVDEAAKLAVKGKRTTRCHGLTFEYTKQMLFITLPSGRKLAYCKPKLDTSQFGNTVISYMGVNQTTKKWERIQTYGPKLVENIVQGIARDCLRDAMINVTEAGFDIVMHVHDEIIAEVGEGRTLEEMEKAMCKVPDWAEGLPLRADGYTCSFYMKD